VLGVDKLHSSIVVNIMNKHTVQVTTYTSTPSTYIFNSITVTPHDRQIYHPL